MNQFCLRFVIVFSLAKICFASGPNNPKPSVLPTTVPSHRPTVLPSVIPSVLPSESLIPTIDPSLLPSCNPSYLPSIDPTCAPTFVPTHLPSELPSVVPSHIPTEIPTVIPTRQPSSTGPTHIPTGNPVHIAPTNPSVEPTVSSILPSSAPVYSLSVSPTTTVVNTQMPTTTVTNEPTPTTMPIVTIKPSTNTVSRLPSIVPINVHMPTLHPLHSTSTLPTLLPTLTPSQTISPTAVPIATYSPTFIPTVQSVPIIIFDSIVYIVGFTGSVVDGMVTLSTADQLAITESVAITLGVSTYSVTYISASLAARRTLRRLSELHHHKHTLSGDINVVCETTVNMIDYPQYGTNSNDLYAYLSSILTTAATSGNLTSTLHTQAVLNTASDLYFATAPSATTDNLIIDTPIVTNNNDNSHKKTFLIGICLVFIIVIILSVFMYFYGCFDKCCQCMRIVCRNQPKSERDSASSYSDNNTDNNNKRKSEVKMTQMDSTSGNEKDGMKAPVYGIMPSFIHTSNSSSTLITNNNKQNKNNIHFNSTTFARLDDAYRASRLGPEIVRADLTHLNIIHAAPQTSGVNVTSNNSYPMLNEIAAQIPLLVGLQSFKNYFANELSESDALLRCIAVQVILRLMDSYVRTSVVFSIDAEDVAPLFTNQKVIISGFTAESKLMLRNFISDNWKDIMTKLLRNPQIILHSPRLQEQVTQVMRSLGVHKMSIDVRAVTACISQFFNENVTASIRLAEIVTLIALNPTPVTFATHKMLSEDFDRYDVVVGERGNGNDVRSVMVIIPSLLLSNGTTAGKNYVYRINN